ncbi:MAG: hypothetical protein RL329_3092 [Bacteroidota bacterium]|jgi:hypothetical protein
MYSKQQQDILNFLAAYLKETPPEVIAQEIKAISAIPYAGATAAHYFESFPKLAFPQKLSETHRQ